MASKDEEKSDPTDRQMPAMNPEDREQQMIALADGLAEKQLRDGTASSQVMVHYLKMGTSMYQLELAQTEKQNLLLEQKVEELKSRQRADSMMDDLFKAIQQYNGMSPDDGDEEGNYID